MALAILKGDREHHTRNPIDVVERLVSENEWTFERPGDDELAVEIAGRWCDYRLFFSWRSDAAALHFSCAFDMRVPSGRRVSVHSLLALVNEKMWLGHFDLWSQDGLPMYRHALPLRGSDGATTAQVEDLVGVALDECERFYPAFQFVIWGGKTPEESIAAALIDTVGEA
jgi:hypothetical protein